MLRPGHSVRLISLRLWMYMEQKIGFCTKELIKQYQIWCAWIEIGAAAPRQLAHTTQNHRCPGLQMQSGASGIKGRHALPKGRNRKRAGTVAQRRKRYHERSKRDLWACTLPDEGGVFSIKQIVPQEKPRNRCSVAFCLTYTFLWSNVCSHASPSSFHRPMMSFHRCNAQGANTSGGGQSGRLSQF